jgi:hypothetical protein
MKRTIAVITLASFALVGTGAAAQAGTKWELKPTGTTVPAGRTWA